MARSHAIWVIMRNPEIGFAILAAFTVKHEMKTYLSKMDNQDELLIVRLPDNPSLRSDPVTIFTAKGVLDEPDQNDTEFKSIKEYLGRRGYLPENA